MFLSSFKSCLDWINGSSAIDNAQYCQTRDVFEGRLNRFPTALLRSAKLSEAQAFLLTAVIGELGNNCFDHNLGKWDREPGTFFGYEYNDSGIWVWVGDKGRGIKSSLAAVHKEITDDKIALQAAFSRKISGRFPENRGNGLKFVRQVINCDQPSGLWRQSGDAQIRFGKLDTSVCEIVISPQNIIAGTVTLIVWGRS